MRIIILILASFALAFASSVRGQDANERDAVLAVQAEVDDAMRANDADRLAPLLTDNFTRTPPTGLISTKAQWLELLRSGRQRYVSIERTETDVRLFGDSAVVTGIIALEVVRADGRTDRQHNRYLRIYVRQDGSWRLAAHQATEIKAP